MQNQLLSLIALILVSFNFFSQYPSGPGVSPSGVLNGVYIKEHIPTKRVVPYSHLSERDVMWSKRVWRTIDLRERMNHSLYYPLESNTDRMCLYDIIKYAAVSEATLTLYEVGATQDDQFRTPIVCQSGESEARFRVRKRSFFGELEMLDSIGEDGEVVYENGVALQTEEVNMYEAAEIVKYEIKEDWFFDKERGVMDVRIIGISPIVYYRNEKGDVLAEKNLFWLYFPECRYVFQNFFVYNDQNDAQRMSFDDLFWKRDFSSIIHKESNVVDRKITPIWVGLDALLESERVKDEMSQLEHDIWNL